MRTIEWTIEFQERQNKLSKMGNNIIGRTCKVVDRYMNGPLDRYNWWDRISGVPKPVLTQRIKCLIIEGTSDILRLDRWKKTIIIRLEITGGQFIEERTSLLLIQKLGNEINWFRIKWRPYRISSNLTLS